ncbi:hypothetical protein [Flavobacterium adhaerens]|uniref:hypothetical protein n=1 Tax=Flavobacterium adhaerens TaxID=3149043 RepID=UPI0032B3484A
MKKSLFKLSLVLAFLISVTSYAQGLNKASLLKELNNTNGVSLNASEKASYEKANNELVTGLLGLDKKNLSKEDRDKEVDKLFDKRDKSLASSLGVKKSSGLNKSIKSTKRKVKLAKMVL